MPEPMPRPNAPVLDQIAQEQDAPMPELEGLTDAERIGVAVVAMVDAVVQQREAARAMAVTMEGQLAEAVKHLNVLSALVEGTTFAHDADALAQVNEFLEGLESPETPDETEDDH